MKVELFKPHTKQRECINKITDSSSKYIIIDCGRQFGKSLLAINLLLKWNLEHPNAVAFWVSPIYSQAKKVFDEIAKALQNTGLIANTNRSEVWIKFVNGSTIHFKSGEKPDNLRGYTLDYLVMDEAAFMRDNIWDEILRPATLVRGKRILFISTPKGKNYFYNLYMRGISEQYPEYLSLKYTSYDTPFITEDEINEAKNTLPTDIFNQEIMAEFIEDGGEVFRGYSVSQIINKWIEPSPNEKYYAGIDLGRQNDFTVVTIVNNFNQICYIYRERRNNWVNIVDNIVSVLQKYNAKAVVEVNSIGDVIYEQIKRKYNKIEPFTTTSSSKDEIINNLIVQINDQILLLPTKELFEPLDTELRVFTFEYSTKSRKIRYFAPPGFHDDTIMSLAMALDVKKNIVAKKYVIV
jgi:PBSX family phage terminase large subunit